MQRLLTALIVCLLAIVLVSPLVDADDAVINGTHKQTVNGPVHSIVLATESDVTEVEDSFDRSPVSPPTAFMRC